MATSRRRAVAWPQVIARFLLLGVATVALPAHSVESGVLTLAHVQRVALVQQPALAAGAANVQALRDESVAAGQLPDPQLITGVTQIPIEDDEAFSLREDDFTALSVGISQEFPRAVKRQLRASALEQRARAGELALASAERQVQLEAGLAYLDVAAAAQGARLLDRLTAEADRQKAVRGIALVAGQGSQADQLAAAVEAEVQADRGRALRQRELAGRAELARWIGATEADQPLPDELPAIPAPPPLNTLLERLVDHPQLAGRAATVRIAQTEARLAGLATSPDWRIEMRYDHRLEFPDLVTLMVGVDLPFFAGDRQDRSSSAARARVVADTAGQDDQLREATAQVTSAYRQWQSGTDRLGRYDESLLPQSRSRVKSALAAYQSGRGTLTTVLDARRSLLDVELMRLDLAVDVSRDRLRLQYFEPEVQ